MFWLPIFYVHASMYTLTGSCETQGQVYQECKTCPATCSNPNLLCTLQCEPGCGCPVGQLIDDITDKENAKCVDPKKCPLPPICAVSSYMWPGMRKLGLCT